MGLQVSSIRYFKTNRGLGYQAKTNLDSIYINNDGMGGGTYIDVKETDGSAVSYTVAAGKLTRVDPSGWAFASTGSIRFVSGATEDTSSAITVLLRDA